MHIVPLGELDERWGRKLVLVKLSWNYKSSKNGAFKAAHPRKNGGVHITAHVTMFSIVTCRYGHRVYGGSECSTRDHIENTTFLRHKRTGLLFPPLFCIGADLLICHTVLGNSPNCSGQAFL